MSKINPEIFKAYDIRGTYPDQVNEETAYAIGFALGQKNKKEIVVGRDMRASSEPLFQSLAQGVTKAGGSVIFLGAVTTPMLNFAVAKKNYRLGVMITASHNPGHYNGFKIIGPRAVQFSNLSGLAEIKNQVQIIQNQADFSASPNIKAQITNFDILPEYLEHLEKIIGTIKPLKIVADAGNGMAKISAEPLFEKLSLKVIKLYFEPDANFPHHDPNPVVEENLTDLKAKVLENKADLGVAFDGDADRAILIDEKGQVVPAALLLCAIATQELKNKHGQKVYYDLRFSKAVPKMIKKAGGEPVRMRIGNPFYKEKIILEGGLMGAEYSGHFMYSENFGLDDGLFSIVKIIYWLSETGKSLSEFVAPFVSPYFQTGEINLEVAEAGEIMNKLEKKYTDLGAKIDKLDGLTCDMGDWWFNLRASNTEPVVRLNIEAGSEKILNEKKTELIKEISPKENF
ncbi:MAG TPA: phosphomannomutase/phosphoglucomutase [Patescibacteria group bacterium]|nr:phosphomannomutase/phosphoglucomutase [Patescibacteria group bacterium]